VTVIERGAHLLALEDSDVAEEVQRILGAEGIQVLLGAKRAPRRGQVREGVRLPRPNIWERADVAGSDILVAAGAPPNTAGIDSTWPGRADARGYIKVNDRLETSAAGCGRLANALAVLSSRTSPKMTSASSVTTLPGERGARATVLSPIAFSPTRPRARRPKRRGGAKAGDRSTCRQASHEWCVANVDHGGGGRLHEGACRGSCDRHRRLHDARPVAGE